MKKILLSILALVSLNVILVSAVMQSGKKGAIPEKYRTMKNPVNASGEALDEGRDLWNKYCKVCHGNSGAGDGVKAKKLERSCGDLSSTSFQSQTTDGEIYYLSFINEVEEHNFDTKIPEETDRWCIVNYLRTFKK